MYDVMKRSSFASEVEQKTRFQYSAPGSDFCFIFLPNSSFSFKWLCGVEHIVQGQPNMNTSKKRIFTAYRECITFKIFFKSYEFLYSLLNTKHTEFPKPLSRSIGYLNCVAQIQLNFTLFSWPPIATKSPTSN